MDNDALDYLHSTLGPQQSQRPQQQRQDITVGRMGSRNEAEGNNNANNNNAAVCQIGGYVYMLENNKWNKIGDVNTCTISMFAKSRSLPNGSMKLTTVQADGSVIDTHKFELLNRSNPVSS